MKADLRRDDSGVRTGRHGPGGSPAEDPSEEEPTAALLNGSQAWDDATLLDEEVELRARAATGLAPPRASEEAPSSSPAASALERAPSPAPSGTRDAAPLERAAVAALPTERLGAVSHLTVPLLASLRGRRLLWGGAAAAVALLGGVLLWALWPSPPPRLRVWSQPSGATVRLDGERIGTTPLTIEGPRLRPDRPVLLELHAPGRQPVRRTLRLAPGERRSIQVDMLPATVKVLVESDPPGASLYANGAFVGTTPVTLEGRTVGERLLLRATAPGHRAVERTVTVAGEHGSTQRIELRLEPEPEAAEEAPRKRRRRRGARRRGRR